MPHVFDLKIPAPDKAQYALPVVIAQVARAVHRLAICADERIAHERFRRFLFVVIISERERRASDANFARDVLVLHERSVVAQQKHALVETAARSGAYRP